jgi:prefoldin subunit 5
MMKKVMLPILSAGVLLASCASLTPATPLMAFADAASSSKDLDTSLMEMSMIDSFQTMGRLGQLPMGFDVGPGDEAVADEVLVLQETFGMVHETMQAVHAIRFTLTLEGDVFKTLAVGFQEQSLQFSEEDASTFNAFIDSFNVIKTKTQAIQEEARTIRQRIGSILREMNRPRTFDPTQIATLQGEANALYETLLPLLGKLTMMTDLVRDGQVLLETYFAEDQSPILMETRDQLTRVYALHQTLLENREMLKESRMAIKESIQTIRVTLEALRDQGISLSSVDQATLSLLRISLREQFRQRHLQQSESRELFQDLKGKFNINHLDIVEEALVQFNDMVTEKLLSADEWFETLQSFSQTIASYLL